MPSATRNMKAKSGKAASVPANPKTLSKTRAQTPRVAAKERTTVPNRSAAARILLSKKPRITAIRRSTK